jgi:uncharacterized BrkB/YihY/UPF0761 family membrane protein
VLGTVAIALLWLYAGAFMILLGAVLVAYLLRWQTGDVAGAAAQGPLDEPPPDEPVAADPVAP